MNMINPENFEELRRDAQPNPALARLMKAWEEKMSKNAKRATGFGMVAVSLAACGGSSTDVTPPPPPPGDVGRTLFLTGVLPFDLAAVFLAAGVGGAQTVNFTNAGEATRFLEALVGSANANLFPILTTEDSNSTVGMVRTTDGDDIIIGTAGMFNGIFIDGGEGFDEIQMDVTNLGLSRSIGVVNVESVLIGNQNLTGIAATIDLFPVVDLQQLTITQDVQGASVLNVSGVRNSADLTFSGSFTNIVNVDYVLGVSAINVTLENVTANAPLVVSHEGGTVNLFTTGTILRNIVDDAFLGNFLQVLNISGETPLQLGVEVAPVIFRASTPAEIDASAASGVQIVMGGHNNVTFTGSDANDALTVATALAPVGTDSVIQLSVDMAGGENTLTIGASAGLSFVTPNSTIAGDNITLITTGAGNVLDMSPRGTSPIDLSAVSTVIVDQASQLNLSAGQVMQVGIENFSTPVFDNASGVLSIVGVSDELLDLSNIQVGTVVNVTTVPGDVTLNPGTVLGNQNAGVNQIIIDNRGQDSSLTMSAAQWTQMQGVAKTIDVASNIVGLQQGTNNPLTGQPYETNFELTGLDNNLIYNFANVFTTTAVVELSDFTAGPDFQLLAGGAELTLVISGEVDLSDATLVNVNNIVLTDGAVLTIDPTAGNFNVIDDTEFLGAATINVEGNNATLALDTDAIVGDASQVTINFVGTNVANLNVVGGEDITLKAVNAGDDITVLNVNNLTLGATVTVTGGSPAMALGEDVATLNVFGDVGTTTLIGTDPDNPDIVSSTLTTITSFAAADAVINLGTLSVTSPALTVLGNNGAGTGVTTVEVADIPAGAAWQFGGVELVINSVAGFGAGATIRLLADTTISGDASLTDIAPFLTADSVVPLDATSSAAEIDAVLQSLAFGQATINVTGMDTAQLAAIVNNSLKVGTINGDLLLTSELTPFQINTLSPLYVQGVDDVLTVDADGMSAAQKAASAGAAAGRETTVLNLTLDSDDGVFTIVTLLPDTANNSTVVEADGMGAAQLNALVGDIAKVAVINDMELTAGNSDLDITALLSKAPAGSVTVDATGMNNAQFTAIVQQITKIDVVENLTVTDVSPDEDFEFTALLELADDANVDAFDMSVARLQIVAENIANIEDDGIINLTLTNELSAAEITALLSKAPAGSVTVDATGMNNAQFTAIVQQITKIDVVENLTVTDVSPDEDFEFTALLELADDANVDAFDMSVARLQIVAENIANIEDDGIINLTLTNELSAAEITALIGKAPDGTVTVNLSEMDADQVAAVTANIDKVAAIEVGVNQTVTLTPAQVITFADAGLAINGAPATAADETGGSIVVLQAAGTAVLDLANVNPGAAGPGTAGSLTIETGAGARINLEPGAQGGPVSLAGVGSLGFSDGTVDLSTATTTIASGLTLVLEPSSGAVAAGNLTLRAEDAGQLTAVTITKPAAAAGEVQGSITAIGPDTLDLDPADLSGINLSRVDTLVLSDADGTILSTNPANLADTITGQPILVAANSNWSAFNGTILAPVNVDAGATLSINVGVAEQMSLGGVTITGANAAAPGVVGGSITITGLGGAEVNLSQVAAQFTPGTSIAPTADGALSIAVSGNVTLNDATLLPPGGGNFSIDIATGSTLTVNGSEASQASNNYAGQGTLRFIEMDGVAVNAENAATGDNDARFVEFVFDSADLGVVINGWDGSTGGGLNGQFVFDGAILGNMRVNVSDFDTNGADVVRTNVAGVGTESVANAGVYVITNGAPADLVGLDLTAVGGTNGQIVFAVGVGADVGLFYWDGTVAGGGNGDGIVDAGEFTQFATITDLAPVDLAAGNFIA